MTALWQQHTATTGQTFAAEIFPELWQDTRGQPWLVNALADTLTSDIPHLSDPNSPITREDYRTAREMLIQSRATHLDQLIDKLKEPRVHRVISAILSSADDDADIPPDDLQYVTDLGLITLRPTTQMANRIYQETVPREFDVKRRLRYHQSRHLSHLKIIR